MTPTKNEQRLKEIEETVWRGYQSEDVSMDKDDYADLLRIAREEMERAKRRGELLEDCIEVLTHDGHHTLVARIQKEIDQ